MIPRERLPASARHRLLPTTFLNKPPCVRNSVHVSGLEKLSNVWQRSSAMLPVIDWWKVTLTSFSAVAQLNNRSTKATSFSAPLQPVISMFQRQLSWSSSVFQFGGWSHTQPDGHPVSSSSCSVLTSNARASFLTLVHILRTWNKLAPKECPFASTFRDNNITWGSLVISSIKYGWLEISCRLIWSNRRSIHNSWKKTQTSHFLRSD